MATRKVSGKKSPLNTWVGGKSGKKGVKYYTKREADGNKMIVKVTKLNKAGIHTQFKDTNKKYMPMTDILVSKINTAAKNPYKAYNPVKGQRSMSKAQPRNAFQSGRYKKLVD